jgi:hypothetical protein
VTPVPESTFNRKTLGRKPQCESLIEARLRRRGDRYKRFVRRYPDMGSINDLFSSYAVKLYEGKKEPVDLAVMCVQRLSVSDKVARKVLVKWEGWREEDRMFEHAFDFCVTECRVPLEPFKQTLLDAMNSVARKKAQSIITTHLPDVALTAMQIAGKGDADKGNRVLQRVMERHDLLDKPPGQVIQVNPTINTATINQVPSGDDFSQMLDRALESRERKQLPASVDGEIVEG